MDGVRAVMKDANLLALERLNLDKYEGECLLLVDGKVVYHGKDASKAMEKAPEGKKSLFFNVPSSDKILVY